MKLNGVVLTRWTVAVVAMVVGLFVLMVSSLLTVYVVWKAAPFIREFGMGALSSLITCSVIVAVLGYILFSTGARLFFYAGLIQKGIRESEAQEIVQEVF